MNLFELYISNGVWVMMYHIFVIVYDVLTGEIVQELNGHKSCVRDVSWHPYRSEITSSSVSIIGSHQLILVREFKLDD